MCVKRQFITNLNSLSESNFEKISIKIIGLLDTHQDDSIFLDVLFEKTITKTEELFIDIYTKLILKIFKHLIQNDTEHFRMFHRMIINRCQILLEQDIHEDNHQTIKNASLFVASLINYNIIKQDLVPVILDILIKNNTYYKTDILIKLIFSLDKKNKLNPSILTKLNIIKLSYPPETRFFILLEQLIDDNAKNI